MSITDELREYVGNFYLFRYKDVREKLDAIADRIDAKHEAALRRKFIDAVLCSTESVMMLASELAERYIELPKDTGGKYIHEHDKVDWRDHAGTWHENATVVAVCDDGCYVMDGTVFHVHKSNIRHHHAPTVEDVLREMHAELDEVTALYVGEAIDSDERDRDEARIFAEYAKRLTLAGDAE